MSNEKMCPFVVAEYTAEPIRVDNSSIIDRWGWRIMPEQSFCMGESCKLWPKCNDEQPEVR